MLKKFLTRGSVATVVLAGLGVLFVRLARKAPTEYAKVEIADPQGRADPSTTPATAYPSHGDRDNAKTAADAALAAVPGRTIVLVGALTPARFAESDASFNLGMAFAAAQIAPPGVYITMNGTVFPADQVVKDRERGAFVPRS